MKPTAMKKLSKYITTTAVAFVATVLATSCSMESPFEGETGEGNLILTTEVRGETVQTRAGIDQATMTSLRERAVVYVERKNSAADSHDVIRKYIGLETIPSSISLAKGNTYLVEGWTGDSVSASFDAKFYRGKSDEFQIEDQTNISLKLNIANVLVSFATETFELGLKDLKMTVKHSRGELTFNDSAEGGSTLSKKGYFMMPSTDKDLEYSITAKTASGESISREGKIENVERAHEYQVRIKANEDPSYGAGLIKIEIADIPVIDLTEVILGRPQIEGLDFDLADQVVGSPGNFTEKIVYVKGYGALSTLVVGSDEEDNLPPSLKNITNNDLTNNTQDEQTEFENIGIHIMHEYVDEDTDYPYDTYRLYFTTQFFDAIPLSDKEYTIRFYAVDRNGNHQAASMRIANTEAAIEVIAPVETAPVPDKNKSPMAILATSATLTGYLYDADVDDYGFEYRKSGESSWNKISAKTGNDARRKVRGISKTMLATRAAKVPFNVTLTGLSPNTTYEYRTYAGEYTKSAVVTFTTEGTFQFPNNSFEEWSTYSASTMLGKRTVTLPGAEGDKSLSFWGSGNEGAATANMTLTDKSTNMFQSGAYSARLESRSAMGVLAAGNIFIGEYVRTDGTNGVLSLGREYNGSHPSKLRVWVNYRPGSGVSVKSGNEEFVPVNFADGNDHAQIYVALTTEPVEIRTNPSDRKVFDSNDPVVLGYGERTFTDKFGSDGSLASIDIPIVYNDRAKSQMPTHIVIVASASKYGDYFSGAAGSVMYLDDFELIYE